ncbi:hypothetical protein V3851_02185 [Paenibacillus sp. M1]|uniref:Uncharacterized protein n=1 Tax=Paenibacillus haidiansis TaxID=1574488 RepID=A0ABU7VLI2_9BACL
MKISTEQYQVAPLKQAAEAVAVIKEAEKTLQRITGEEITLIAYEQTGRDEER